MQQPFDANEVHVAAFRAGRLSAAGFAALVAVSAQAQTETTANEPNPYYIGISETLSHDTNVNRVPGGPSDSYSTTSLHGGFDQRISRQRVYANANVGLSRYRDQTALNNTNYGVAAGWDWATIEKLSGTISVGLNQSLANNGDNTSVVTTTRNLVRTERYGASARLGGDSTLSLDGNYAHSKVSYSELSRSDSSSDSASVGLFYRAGAALRLGTALRYSRSETPVGALQDDGTAGANKEEGHYLDLIADWQPTAQTSLDSRLSWTRQTNSLAGSRDFDGLTGAVVASYAPTAKLAFNASYSRDAGVNGNFFTLSPTAAPGTTPTTTTPTTPVPQDVTGLSESSQLTNLVSLGARYAATAKIDVVASAQFRRARLVDTTSVAGVSTNIERNDTSRQYSLGVTYGIARNWQLGCHFSHYTRDLEATAVTQGIAYNANLTSCSAQFTLR